MALTKCPECKGKVSDTALTCPHCGYDLNQPEKAESQPPKGSEGKYKRFIGYMLIVLLVIAGVDYYSEPDSENREGKSVASIKEEVPATKAEQSRQKEKTSSSDSGDDYANQIAWVSMGKDAVRGKLKDPDAAKFKDTFFNRGSDGIPMTCGYVNSKNGFGAYIGYQRFISAAKPELTFLEEQVKGFDTLWQKFCT